MQLFIVVLGLSTLALVSAMSGEEELKLSADEQGKLDVLKSGLDDKVKACPYLGNEVIQKHFLKANGMDVNKAKKALEDNQKWDETRKVADAEYPDLKVKIGGSTDAVDKEGRVVLYLKVNKWEWSAAIAELKINVWKNTFYKLMDEAMEKTLKIYPKHARFYVIADYIGWVASPLRGLCPPCLIEVGEIARRFESRWPHMKSTIAIVMTPDAYKAILDIIRPIFSKETNDALKIHGMDKGKWWAELQKDISDEELKKLPFDENPNPKGA